MLPWAHIKNLILCTGQDLYRQLQSGAESGFQSSFSQDHTAMLKQIQHTMEQLSAKLDHVQNLWRDKEWEVSGLMQVTELEQGMRTVSGHTNWLRYSRPCVSQIALHNDEVRLGQ